MKELLVDGVRVQEKGRLRLSVAAAVVLVGVTAGVSAEGVAGPIDGHEPLGLAESEATDDESPLDDDDVFVPRPGREQGEAEAMAIDTMKIAENEGWSFEEAQRRLATQEVFAEFGARLRVQFPDSFTEAWTTDGKRDSTPFVRFVGAVPDEARTQAEELGLEVHFLDDARYTAVDLEARSDQITQDLIDAGYRSFIAGSSGIDELTHVTMTRPPEHRGRGGQSDSQLRRELPASARASDVSVEFSDHPVRATQVYGGGQMQRSGNQGCTSGFVVSHDASRGVSNAGHCEADNQYRNPETGAVYAAPARGQCVGACREQFGDFRWHETAQPHLGHFYINRNNNRRRATTVRSQFGFQVNQRWCGFGRASGVSDCADVILASADCVTTDGWTAGRSVFVDASWMRQGDSGGPWFLGRRAAGTQVAASSTLACFSRAALMVNTPMGIDVVARDRKVRGERMPAGGSIWSPNSQYQLVMQATDGNLVAYGPSGAYWATGTQGAGNWAMMQADGNFVVYSSGGSARWATGTSGGGNKIMLQNDGNLVVYSPNEGARWVCC